jgi:hypothetical protein
MDQHAGFNIHVVVFVIPVSFECDGDAFPPVRVDMAKAVTNNVNYAPSKDVWLLIKVDVVLVRIVEPTGLNRQ